MSEPIGLVGRIAIELGLVTEAQVQLCLRVQAQLGGKHHLGALFINRGYITEDQLQEILAVQRERQATSASRPTLPAVPEDRAFTPAPPPSAPSVLVTPPPPIRAVQPSPPPVQASPSLAAAPLAALVATQPAQPSVSTLPVATGAAAARIPTFLELAEKKGASDVHFHPSAPAALRVGGRLLVSTQAPMEDRELAPQLRAVLSMEQRVQLERELTLDALVTTPSGLRCRANFYVTNTGLNATFRLVRRGPPTLAELGLPGQLASFVSYSQGMVLVTGLSGSGKTSTLAALVNLIAEERADHVLCLEDPVEIVHPAKKALVNQRQVGRDTESFGRALRGALREDPDVIVIGDLRDAETISLAITAAETGHLVLGSMNTASSSRAISRILGAFPPAQQQQVRSMVSESLRGVITQRLVPTLDGGRTVALEVLVVTPAIGNLIRDDKLFQIRSAMQTGRGLGMRSMDESLRELVLSGRVSPEEARRVAENPGLIPTAAAPPPAPPAPATPLRPAPPTGRR